MTGLLAFPLILAIALGAAVLTALEAVVSLVAGVGLLAARIAAQASRRAVEWVSGMVWPAR